MKKYIKDTLKYYEKNSSSYNNMWKDIDFEIPNIFLSYLKEDAYILDLGCGTGRDSKFFLDRGYKVKAIDGSFEMCKIASENTEMEVEKINFLDLDYHNEFEVIFACASLLHLDNEDLIKLLKKIKEALKEQGMLYTRFKYGDEERYYNDMTLDKFKLILKETKELKLIKSWISEQKNTNRQFINLILRKEV